MKLLYASLALAALIAAGLTRAEGVTSGFNIATAEYLTLDGIAADLVRTKQGRAITVSLEEHPTMRWNSSWGSYPKFVADTLRILGDANALYKGHGALQVTGGERVLLADTVKRFRAQLEQRGLRLRLVTLDRDIGSNHRVHGDINSDHLIGLAADGVVSVAPCAKPADCRERDRLARTPLEQQLRIIEAATAAGAQQLNLYGVLHEEGDGQSIHIGVSPFRNGGKGEMLGKVAVDGVRRIGYGSAQKGEPGTLSKAAATYVGFDGTTMRDAFQKLLHNPPPSGYATIFEAIREHDLEKLKTLLQVKSSSLLGPAHAGRSF